MGLETYHVEHSTWTDRKIDRLGYTTASGRAELLRFIDAGEDKLLAEDKRWFSDQIDALVGKHAKETRLFIQNQTAGDRRRDKVSRDRELKLAAAVEAIERELSDKPDAAQVTRIRQIVAQIRTGLKETAP